MKYNTIIFICTAILLSACKAEEIVKDIRDSIVDEAVDYGSALVETTSKPTDPDRVLPPNPADCPNWQKDEVVSLTESLTMPTGCKYDRVSIVIANQSDLVFNCNGTEFNGLDREFRQAVGVAYTVENAPIEVGILVQSSESFQTHNVTIKNCHLRNYVRGIRVNHGFSTESRNDLKNNVNVVALENHLRNVSPKNVRVESSTIKFSHKDGLYIGRFITDFVLDNSTINGTGAVGIYLDSGSQRNTIKNSTISENGHSDYNSSKRIRRRKLSNDTREGIAIDSSAQNIIENNVFAKNSRGSILIYKNCNEHAQDPKQIPRYQSADDNTIRNNQFNDERIGVWVASRQSKDLAALDCGIKLVDTGKIRYAGLVEETTKFYEDFAKNNTVTQNIFNNVKNGMIIEDNNTSIIGNEFKGSAEYDVLVGTKYRTLKSLRPVTATKIENNKFNTALDKPIRLVYNPVDTRIKNNTPSNVNN